MKIYASKRFLKNFRKASIGLQKLAIGAIHNFVWRYRSDPRTVTQLYDKVAGLNDAVLEIDLSGANRLLAAYATDQLIMVDIGGHEIVGRYTTQKLVSDLINMEVAPLQFLPEQGSRFFTSIQDKNIPMHFPEEVSTDWIYFLSDEQESTMLDIYIDVMYALDDTYTAPVFLLGGPGTGKTCILLNLLLQFVDEGLSCGIHISDNLIDYVEKSTGTNLRQFNVSLAEIANGLKQLDILLIDDPETDVEIRNVNKLINDDRLKTVVIAMDPLQLQTAMGDAEFYMLRDEFDCAQFSIKVCYRQKENVGIATKQVADVIAASTPFLREDKVKTYREERQELTELANNLVFINPHGYTHYYENATLRDLHAEVERILQVEWLMWKHWPGLLLIEEVRPPESWMEAFQPLFARNYVHRVSINEINSIKGLEFQHAFIILSQQLFNEVQQGFKGTGQKVYNERRLLRIPFSRARDSLVTFAIDDI